MTAQDWRSAIDEILYGLTYTKELTDETVQWVAESAVNYTSLGLGPEVYYRAIGDALESGELLDGRRQLPQFGEAPLASFLNAVAARIDALRPWPEPKFRRIESPEASALLRDAVPIARLDASIREISDVVQQGFRPAGNSYPGQHLLALRLNTGETVSLLGSYSLNDTMLLLADVADDPAITVENLVSATGLANDKFTLI